MYLQYAFLLNIVFEIQLCGNFFPTLYILELPMLLVIDLIHSF